MGQQFFYSPQYKAAIKLVPSTVTAKQGYTDEYGADQAYAALFDSDAQELELGQGYGYDFDNDNELVLTRTPWPAMIR